ncbi:riboflavin kinase [Purpureocillium lilacinum]|uniref:Riboflavin kinase n=1 Tax=Purpureocillium lilacinum TaxID=33203 RepID=A0A179HWN0_PURLI|nr:riboflavin kinase [Purpureocillium lilacinum]KAK4086746.1 hypothetical protein Purlil1_8911 [Purpureocillium lilacinum]OAQ93961.1 riboflavin kinase [Purpureocillium lilacinum]GJN67723.1 hypothetical protein PLICBS_001751 [Purpureocillium lilacinum]
MEAVPRRRPLASRSPNGSYLTVQQPQPPPPGLPPSARPGVLRPCRSAAQLRANGARQEQRPEPLNSTRGGHAEVGFPIDDLPPPYSPYAPASHSTTGGNGGGGGELRRVQSSSALSQAARDAPSPNASFLCAAPSSPSSSTASQASKPSRWKAAFTEAQYVAGGLVSRPAESTRHYSIIRHSHALVWYRGPSTSVSVTILADEPLPPGRKLWLQEKGYSGGLGMTVKAFMGSTGSWLDVTPAREARPEHIPEVDERGIQRDLRRFAKRASGRLKAHVARETHVVRIPATATDGYFRLVLCAGEKEKDKDSKKVLCGSPVFRIASTSTDVAIVRGASLSTMPLELGVKVASTIGQQVAKKYTGVAGAVVQNRAAKVAHYAAAKTAGKTVLETYHKVGLADSVNDSWQRSRQGQYGQHLLEPTITVIGSDAGPSPPFPLKFDGKVAAASGRSVVELGYPTANLKDVSDAIKTRLGGVFAAWVMIVPAKGLEDVDSDWHEAVVTIAPPRDAPPSVAMRNSVAVHIAFDFDGVTFYDARLKVLLMGYLHAASLSSNTGELADEHAQDVMTTLASLGRDNWQPHDTVTQMRSIRSERSFSDRLTEATGKVQEQVDRIPLHWAGVRSDSGTARDQMYGNGGIWIAR